MHVDYVHVRAEPAALDNDILCGICDDILYGICDLEIVIVGLYVA